MGAEAPAVFALLIKRNPDLILGYQSLLEEKFVDTQRAVLSAHSTKLSFCARPGDPAGYVYPDTPVAGWATPDGRSSPVLYVIGRMVPMIKGGGVFSF